MDKITNNINKYTKEKLEEALQHFSFYEIIQIGDKVTNYNASVLHDTIISKGTNSYYDHHNKKIINESYFICKNSGKWNATSKGWTLEPKPLKRQSNNI